MIPNDIEAVALLGWRVFPCSSVSKAGMFKGAHLAATCDLNTIAGWSREYPRCNWRVLFGPSRLWGLDLDVPPMHHSDGIAAFTALAKVHGHVPPRPQARSGGGGLGLFFSHNGERIIGEGGQPSPGIDPRRGQQTQTIPPSVHIVTRKPYHWITPPWEVAPPVAPAWLLKLLEPPPEPTHRTVIDTDTAARRTLMRACHSVMTAGDGNRNATLNRRAWQAGRLIASNLLDEREAIETLYGAARQAGLDHAEIKATLKSGIASGMRAGADGR